MKNLIVLVGVLCIVAAIPVPEKPQSSLDLLQIPLSGNKELDIVSLTDDNGKLTERNKRTIDILRQLFPTLTQMIEAKIQAILPILIRTLGPVLLRGAAGGGAGGAGSSSTDSDNDDDFASEVEQNTNNGGRKVSVSLPSFEVGADDSEEEEETPVAPASSSSSTSSSTSTSTTSTTTTSGAQSSSSLTDSNTNFDEFTRIDLPTTFEDQKQQPLTTEDSSATTTTTTSDDNKLEVENAIV